MKPSANGPDRTGDGLDAIQPVSAGVGPLLQRDYWAVIAHCSCRPSQMMELVCARFLELPPPAIVVFERCDGDGELEVGDELDISIRLRGSARVRVVHRDACSITLATLAGHPEAGRITFGAYRNDSDQVLFHIRSRARASTRANYLGFLFGGDPMQTATWTDFVANVARTCGAGVESVVHAGTTIVEPDSLEPGDETMDLPTFVARAD